MEARSEHPLAQAVVAYALERGVEPQAAEDFEALVGHGAGMLALRGEPRPEAARAIQELRALGVRHVSMLTGDNERTAQAIARAVGLDEIQAELKPEDKVAAVQRLRERHGAIAMVGDGINDAPRSRPPTSSCRPSATGCAPPRSP